MKKLFLLVALLGAFLFSSCIKDLSQLGIYEFTKCYGYVLEERTQQPIPNVRVVTTDGISVDETVYTGADGSFEIKIYSQNLSKDEYYICIEADDLFQSHQINVKELSLGMERYDMGTYFFEGPEVPIMTTSHVDEVSTTSARCHGAVNESGHSTIVERGFVFNTMQYPTIDNSYVQVEMGTAGYDAVITNLAPNTTYYVRSYARNGVGIGYGEQVEFKTQTGLADLTTAEVGSISPVSAISGGHIVNDGGFRVTNRGVCWSVAPNPTLDNAHTANGSDTGFFESKLTNLLPSTTYYVRAYAVNYAGVAYGNEQVFTTSTGFPEVITQAITTVTETTADCGGEVVSDGGFPVTKRGVCYGVSSHPTVSGSHTSDGYGLGSFSSHLSALTPGVTYYYRAYATNGAGTSYGEQFTFVAQ